MFDLALNGEQQAVVDFDGGPLRVIAGAGTGKTTALTARVAGLVERRIRPDRVLLLTFTRRAARQMMSRARARTGERGGARLAGGTFHSVAHHTLRRHAARIGLPDGFSVLDAADAADVFDLVREELGWATRKDRRLPRKATLLDLYSRSVNTQQRLSTVIQTAAPWALEVKEEIAEICRAYVERKRALGLLDFDDLLLWHRAALLDDLLGPRLASSFDHVLVDEYQDVNSLQVDILRALRRDDPRIAVVGDDAQAIYGFRSASPRHLLDFETAFPDAHTIVLHRNYRSSQPICDIANAVADDAPEGFRARLQAQRPHGPRPELIYCHDEDAQVEEVCDRILEARERGTLLRDQAVLIRANHHSALLELALSERAIPFVKYGGLRFVEAAHVKDLVCTFRLADNPHDEIAWFRVLQLLDGVGPATARRIIESLALPTPAVLERWPTARMAVPAHARDQADALAAALTKEVGENVPTHADRIRRALAPVIEQHYEDARSRLVDLDTLVAAAHNAVRLSDVAVELTLEPPVSASDLAGSPSIDEDWLVISTVHSAKGLEWEVVHVLSATDGNFPSDMALATAEELEEERRLFYVGLTRPRRHLSIYVPLRYHHHPKARDDFHLYSQPSRFLSARVVAQLEPAGAAAAPASIGPPDSSPPRPVDLALDALWA
jgi:DNA helicase-2/ATP-dependent DNA helicase PcrA